ncbi:unnamed protein product [Dovyalis caffra]|uniref:Uncharacterized protein n=1 Tax=Dovyalis caffra TaxID=77055 RepID=A0AAV1QNM6_9ROSI|nr:unnamed protein product [Dovyalis caffra]
MALQVLLGPGLLGHIPFIKSNITVGKLKSKRTENGWTAMKKDLIFDPKSDGAASSDFANQPPPLSAE